MSDPPRRTADEPAAQNRMVAIPRELPNEDRRRLLSAVGGVGAVVLAGCLDAETEPEDEPDDDDDVATYDVVFLDHDETVSITEDEVLLYPALDAGVDIPYTCEVGTCGECTARYDGDATEVITHDGNEYLDDDQVEDGWVLTCVASPEDDFELEVAHPDDE
ncbi:2Fe-2S iron-sulfur cluster-binding protein [Natronorubrum sp. A-ect3]|uniref:2Fe-2S iron-sulfur cluster-binding protein n=1 Tax=Natronorubrum sp. A-ect3 TaxID=3242698 RepID=UPI00359DCAEB